MSWFEVLKLESKVNIMVEVTDRKFAIPKN